MSESFTICGIKPTAEVGNQTFGIRIGHCRDGRGPQCAEYTWPKQSSIRLQTVNAVGVRSRLLVMLGSEPDEHSDICCGACGSDSVRPYRRACARSDCGARS